jgi:hypothetical protein
MRCHLCAPGKRLLLGTISLPSRHDALATAAMETSLDEDRACSTRNS